MKSANKNLTQKKGCLLLACLLVSALTVAAVPQAHSGSKRFSDWSEPVNLGPIVNSPFDDNHPAISKDGLSLYFHSNRPGGFGGEDIWVSQRASLDDPWEPPQNLGSTINTSSNDRVPFLSHNGHWLFFGSNRPGGQGGIDLWISLRTHKHDDFNWQPPVNLGPTINSAFDDDGATLFKDECGTIVLYFTSNRPGGLGDFDIYASEQQDDGAFAPATLVPELSSPQRDTRTAIRRDGLEMLLTSNRTGSQGLDLWVATRASTCDVWSPPVRLDSLVNSAANDGAPALSFDGQTLFFYSNRPGGLGGNDLYMSTRTRVRGRQ